MRNLEKSSYVTSDVYIGYINKMTGGILADISVLSTETITNSIIVIYMQKDSSLLTTFDKHIQKLADYGIIRKWINEYEDRKYFRSYRIKLPRPVSFSQIEGIFYICGILHCIAILVFVVELLWRWLTERLINVTLRNMIVSHNRD